jgi:3,4-dihydroxy-2-butanone 4-phosphate synthase
METLKTKITVTEKREVEKEIELPYYSKSEYEHYVIYGDGKTVTVWLNKAQTTTNISTIDSANDYEKAIAAEPCTEQEFYEAMQKAICIIAVASNLLIDVGRLPEPKDFETASTEPNVSI